MAKKLNLFQYRKKHKKDAKEFMRSLNRLI